MRRGDKAKPNRDPMLFDQQGWGAGAHAAPERPDTTRAKGREKKQERREGGRGRREGGGRAGFGLRNRAKSADVGKGHAHPWGPRNGSVPPYTSAVGTRG